MTDKPVNERIAEDRAHYLAHPDDEDEWEEVPAPAEASAKRLPGAMISVRLSAEEADEIRAAADEEGQSVSGFMRKVVLDRIRNSRAIVPAPTFVVGNFSRVVTHVELEPGAPVSGGVPSTTGASW